MSVPVIAVEIGVPSAITKSLTKAGKPVPAPVAGMALIDTGASQSCVHSDAIAGLGVSPVGSGNVGTPSGQGSHYKYPARLNFTDMGFTIEFSSAIGVDLTGQLGGNMVVLVGRDILARCLFIYNGSSGCFTLAL